MFMDFNVERGASDGAGVARRRRLAAGEEELERQGQVEVDVEELELDGGAQAHGRLQLHQPLQHRAAFVHTLLLLSIQLAYGQ